MASTVETTLNVGLAELLDCQRHDWVATPENRDVLKGGGQIDILITESGWPSVIMECKIGMRPENVRKRFENRFKDGSTPQVVFEVKYDEALASSGAAGDEMRSALAESKLSFCVHYDAKTRFPAEGFLEGDVRDLALAVQYGRESLQYAEGGGVLNDAITASVDVIDEQPTPTKKKISEIMSQEPSVQTYAMASLIVSGALQFHDTAAAPHGFYVLGQMRSIDGMIDVRMLQDTWGKILRKDYFPIFNSAADILRVLPAEAAAAIIHILDRANGRIATMKLGNSPDLYGQAFQKVIPDRKKLAAYYTLPESAAMMASLVFHSAGGAGGGRRNNRPDIDAGRIRMADFACGSGTLLQAAYKRLAAVYESATGKSMRDLHPYMMEHNLVGADVLPVATHLTAVGLSNMYPTKLYKQTGIYQPEQAKRENKIGSLEWIKDDVRLVPSEYKLASAGLQQETKAPGHNSFDVVMMNPPYNRSKGPGGQSSRADPQQIFTAFGASDKDRRAMGRRASKLFANSKKTSTNYCANKKAGLATFFMDLAHAKLRGAGGSSGGGGCCVLCFQ